MKSKAFREIRDLSGHSGCRVILCENSKGEPFVRKISKSKDYNPRLIKQMKKQQYFCENIAKGEISAPRI